MTLTFTASSGESQVNNCIFDFKRNLGTVSPEPSNGPSTATTTPDVVIVGTKLYQRIPETPNLPGKTWLIKTIPQVPTETKALLRLYTPLSSPPEPHALLATLATRLRFAQKVGTPILNGVPTTEYSISLVASGTLIDAKLPTLIWLDAESQLRQIRVALSTPDAGAASVAVPPTETISYTDYGVPVNVSPPPQHQVTTSFK